MSPLIFQHFPAPAKLNLFLHIVGRRADGYHLIETAFRLIDFNDTVSLALRDDTHIVMETPIAGVNPDQDLSVLAARLLQAYSSCRRGVSIRLHKQIPMGGGLGGGSSNAATVLLALNQIWELDLPRKVLQELGLQLGADVPVFIFGRNALATGVGEKLHEIKLKPAWYVIIHPNIQVPTRKIFEIFSQEVLTATGGTETITILKRPKHRRNDLQNLASAIYPAIADALEALGAHGSPLMTGSGSCVFLEFFSKEKADKAYNTLSLKYNVFLAKGLDRHPMNRSS